MNLLVTGGAGFIGSNFVLQQLKSDPSIKRLVNLDLLTYAGNPANLAPLAGDSRHKLVQGDIGDIDLVKRLLVENEIDAIINFAAESHVDRSIDGPEAFIQTNVVGTLRLLQVRARVLDVPERCKEGRLPLPARLHRRSLRLSRGNRSGLHRRDPFAPNSPYAASKASSDHLVRAFHHTYGLPVLTTNCSNNYGPLQFPEKLIPLIIQKALSSQQLPIYGDGMNIRDWLYVGDHATAIRVVAVIRAASARGYNVGGINERTNIAVVDTICGLLDEFEAPTEDGTSYSSLKTFVADRPGHDRALRDRLHEDHRRVRMGSRRVVRGPAFATPSSGTWKIRTGAKTSPPATIAMGRPRTPNHQFLTARHAKASSSRQGSATSSIPPPCAVSKQLMPVYDEPIHLPLYVLTEVANIREILIISTPHDLPYFEATPCGDGRQFGLQVILRPSNIGPTAGAGVRHRRGNSSPDDRRALVLR